MIRRFRDAAAQLANAGAALLVAILLGAVAVEIARADDKPVSIMLENAEPTADELKKMGLKSSDVVLSIEALDLATAGAQSVTMSLPAKQKITLSLKPAAGGGVKVRLDVSFRGKKCINHAEASMPSGKTIRFALKATSPAATCELKW